MKKTKQIQRRRTSNKSVSHEIRKKKNNQITDSIQTKLTVGQPGDEYEQEADNIADQVMRMPDPVLNVQMQYEEEEPVQTRPLSDSNTPWIQKQPIEEEEELQAKIQRQEEEEPIQTKSMQPSVSPNKSWLQTNLDNSKGQGNPLPDHTRSFMETRFGSNFSNVRIHNGSSAIEMNKSVYSQAFTNGNNIYFNIGKYNPDSDSGKKLLAHELTHVVQQNGTKKTIQKITCTNASATPPARAAAGQRNQVDRRASAIISIATNSQYSNIQKATRLITSIVCNYYPQHSRLVRNILYVANTSGLMTSRVGRGSNARGDITVGDYFIQHTTSRGISRRILQVGHELRHILQYRQGLIGSRNKNEREFLAFHENALADEFVGTGRMSRGTRRSLIDGALGYYYCLSPQKQTQYNAQKLQLLARRQLINRRAGRGATNPPTTCAHP